MGLLDRLRKKTVYEDKTIERLVVSRGDQEEDNAPPPPTQSGRKSGTVECKIVRKDK